MPLLALLFALCAPPAAAGDAAPASELAAEAGWGAQVEAAWSALLDERSAAGAREQAAQTGLALKQARDSGAVAADRAAPMLQELAQLWTAAGELEGAWGRLAEGALDEARADARRVAEQARAALRGGALDEARAAALLSEAARVWTMAARLEREQLAGEAAAPALAAL
jgi:hypothetical protein